VDYPAYGSTSSSQYKPSSSASMSKSGVARHSDRKLAHSAQMFHYEHQKQQMLELERSVAVLTI